MSIESWKAEFYPVPAHEVPVDQAIAHSLRKWEGLRDENLDRHNVTKAGRRLWHDNESSFCIDSSTCALCHHYLVNGDDDVYDIFAITALCPSNAMALRATNSLIMKRFRLGASSKGKVIQGR